MTFSKDVNTRKYLACNQAFAEHDHKETPDGVVGLTDFEIFDEQTALHFIEDDKKALSMDRPYIFYEDVPDAAGNPRQFQTTKLKFMDDTGRECLLGLCQDVTDAMRIKREYTEKLALVQNMAEVDALTSGGVVIACGMEKHDREDSVAAVFEIADKKMYENKKYLKTHRG